MSECCKNCIFQNNSICTNDIAKEVYGDKLVLIEDLENSKCELYEDCR